MSRESSAYDIAVALDLTAHGITTPAEQIRRAATLTDPQVRPFVVLKWGDTTPQIKSLSTLSLQVWAYHESSYTPVDAILDAIRVAYLSSGALLGDVVWNGKSADLYDDVFKCVTRYSAFTIPAGLQ